MDSNIIVGTELKFNLFIEPLNDIHAKNYDFSLKAYSNRTGSEIISKADCIPVDNDNFIVTLDTTNLGVGALTLELTAYIPDEDFDDGLRTEIIRYDTGLNLIL